MDGERIEVGRLGEELRTAAEKAASQRESATRILERARSVVERAQFRLDAADRVLRQSRPLVRVEWDSPSESLNATVSADALERRPAPPPNYRADAEAYRELMAAFATEPETALGRLVEIARRLCAAETAGLSVAEDAEEGRVFRWWVTQGALRQWQGTAMPYEASPCGLVVEQGRTLLMERPDRAFPDAPKMQPEVVELLLAPFYERDRPVGTLWVVNHGGGRPFHAEDRRLLEGLTRFVAPAVRLAA